MTDHTYREPSPDPVLPTFPRWPALRGLAVLGRSLLQRAGWRVLGRWIAVALAFAFYPTTVLVHRLRSLGGADPERRDVARYVAESMRLDASGWQTLGWILGLTLTVFRWVAVAVLIAQVAC